MVLLELFPDRIAAGLDLPDDHRTPPPPEKKGSTPSSHLLLIFGYVRVRLRELVPSPLSPDLAIDHITGDDRRNPSSLCSPSLSGSNPAVGPARQQLSRARAEVVSGSALPLYAFDVAAY